MATMAHSTSLVSTGSKDENHSHVSVSRSKRFESMASLSARTRHYEFRKSALLLAAEQTALSEAHGLNSATPLALRFFCFSPTAVRIYQLRFDSLETRPFASL